MWLEFDAVIWCCCMKVLPVEMLHGFTFALAWAAGTAFVSKIAPPGLETTTQAIFYGLYYGELSRLLLKLQL
jgi:hypothetical protein